MPEPHTPELRLLLLAASVGDERANRSEVESLLGGEIDWTQLIRAALQQRLVAALFERLQPFEESLLPGDIAYALQYRVERNGQQSELLMRAAAELATELAGHGLRTLFFGGPVLALQAYEELARRDPTPPCILTDNGSSATLRARLIDRGFREDRDAVSGDGARVFHRAEDGAGFRVFGLGDREPTYASFSEGAVELAYDGCRIPVPSIENCMRLIAEMAGAGNWAQLGDGRDWAQLLRRHPETDIAALLRAADGAGLVRLQTGLALAVSLLTDAPPLLELPSEARQAAARIHARVLDPEPQPSALHGRAAKSHNEVQWGVRSDAWRRWAEASRRDAAPFNRALFDAVGIEQGQCVLDLACGVGDTSLDLAPLLGARGRAVAADLAFDMVSKARLRAQESDTALHGCAADMEALPFAAHAFDAVVCRLGIMYAPDPEQALRETRRVLRPGGRAAFLVCGERVANPILDLVRAVATEMFELPAEDLAIDPHRFSQQDSLARIMTAAGFTEVREIVVEREHHAAADFRFWQASFERGFGILLELLPPMTLAELDRRMSEAFAPYLRQGRYVLPSRSRVTVGAAGA